MFGLFKKNTKYEVVSPVRGEAVPIQKVSDPTFGEEILGKGIAVIPEEGLFYAPADGTVTLLFDTLHAVSITSEDGVEILVHVGLDTVELKGAPFQAHVKTGDTVKKGDLLLEADLAQIRASGRDIITPIIICNTSDFKEISTEKLGAVNPGDVLLTIEK